MPKNSHPIEAELIEFSNQLTSWRQAHRQRTRLPEEFWQEAVRLARRRGLHRTARTLRLDYKRLKERLAASNGAPTKFVEVTVTAPNTVKECVLVMEASRGKLRLELKAMPVEEIARLVRALSA